MGNSVIARSKDLILVPEPEQNKNKTENNCNTNKLNKHDGQNNVDPNDKEVSVLLLLFLCIHIFNTIINWLIFTFKNNLKNYQRQSSFETLHTVFDPTFCFDYIKAGVEAIIEDQVTSRFEAEELKVRFKIYKYNIYINIVINNIHIPTP